MNALLEVPEVVAESTHSRIDWTDPEANPEVKTHTGPIAVLRDADGKFLAVEDVPELPDVAMPMTLVQHMKSSDLKRRCIVWAKWDGVREAGFWDATPTRMPLYRAENPDAPVKRSRRRPTGQVAAKAKRARATKPKPIADEPAH